MKKLVYLISFIILTVSCQKENIVHRNIESTMWKISKITETPISNEFGSIQCAIEISNVNPGGFKFGEKDWDANGGSGTWAYWLPSDSIKKIHDFSWQMMDNGNDDYELQIYNMDGTSKFFKIKPTDTRNDAFEMYYEEENPCGDIVRYTFSLEKVK